MRRASRKRRGLKPLREQDVLDAFLAAQDAEGIDAFTRVTLMACHLVTAEGRAHFTFKDVMGMLDALMFSGVVVETSSGGFVFGATGEAFR